ncbi:hypothetical protein SD77_4454 [Bacillus badius]|uniref:Mobile element protein n=1 Tax=Bacillus badius TaxID=1455 RepID=A0ABR5AVT5_BACBA|nr:hypothetical protein SD77_4454 [Bacillus badius]
MQGDDCLIIVCSYAALNRFSLSSELGRQAPSRKDPYQLKTGGEK